jgi:DEAD/DEAH box helicase domain-containing protein
MSRRMVAVAPLPFDATPTRRATTGDVLDLLRASGGDRLVHVERLAPRPPRFGELRGPLPAAIGERFPLTLWSHQARAIDLALRRRSVVVATGTASGKSLCFQAPIAAAAAEPIRPGTALLIYPTKALAHDQLRALTALELPGVVAGAYDGDATPEARTWMRRNATVLLTNPEMLHSGILPNHQRWAMFLARLRYVVVDEAHAFRGVFGSHVAHVLRRLRRLAAHHGAQPSLVACSATIGEPARLASALWGSDVEPVTDDGSPRGERLVAVWNPPLLDEASGTRGSAHVETASVVADLIASGRRTLGFCRSRRVTEVVAADVGRRLPSEQAARIRAYRGGYLAEERREIEDLLFGGALDGVVATSALELGIDIGGLDAVVLDGFPGTIASFWQQSGRAGRGGRSASTVLVAARDQLDQWLATHPDQLLTRPPEPAVVNPANPYVLDAHLRCAAYELPLRHGDERWWPGLLDDGVRRLALADDVEVRRRTLRGATVAEPIAVWAGSGWPTHAVGLRSGRTGEVRIVDAGDDLIGTVDLARAPEQLHPGASYVHQGMSYRVTHLDLDARTATVELDDGTTYTTPRTDVDIRLSDAEQCTSVGSARLCLGGVDVTTRVVGYQRKDALSHDIITTEPLDLPPATLATRAFWYVVPHDVLRRAGLDRPRAAGALHAAEHAAIGMLPLFAICDRWDVGGVSTAWHRDTGAPTIVIHDGQPGGVGVAELGFEAASRHLAATLDVIRACRCAFGCPSCVQSPKCGNGNEPLDKAGAIALLATLLGV